MDRREDSVARAACTFRAARPEEAPRLTELALLSKRSWGYADALIELWRADLEFTPASIRARTVVVAERRGEVVGVLALAWSSAAAELDALWVHPSRFGEGIGRALFQRAVAEARGRGAAALVIVADPHAEQFYARMGASRAGVVASTPGDRQLPRLVLDLATGATSARVPAGGPMRGFVVSSALAAPPERVWNHAVSPAGVNAELAPLFRMTFPRDAGDFTTGWRPGVRLCRSWMLLGGVVPIEYDDLALAEVEPGRRFLERSTLLSQRVWEHERIIEPTASGCRLTDRVRFLPRVPLLAPPYAPIFAAVFRFRHRNLRRLFGAGAA